VREGTLGGVRGWEIWLEKEANKVVEENRERRTRWKYITVYGFVVVEFGSRPIGKERAKQQRK